MMFHNGYSSDEFDNRIDKEIQMKIFTDAFFTIDSQSINEYQKGQLNVGFLMKQMWAHFSLGKKTFRFVGFVMLAPITISLALVLKHKVKYYIKKNPEVLL
jgi:hypothetical protein